MKKIPQVKDDPEIAKLLQMHYKKGYYLLTATNSGQDRLKKALSGNFELIILDLTLPDTVILEIYKGIRKHNIPISILMLTSRSQEIDKVQVLELRQDNYLTIPFGISELMAQSKACIRRTEQLHLAVSEIVEKNLVKDLLIDLNLRKASLKGGRDYFKQVTKANLIKQTFQLYPLCQC